MKLLWGLCVSYFTCFLHDSTGVKLVLYTQTLPPTQTKSSPTIAIPPPHNGDIDG